MKEIYFDNAATTKVSEEVIKVMVETMNSMYANADSSHNFGMRIAKKIKEEKKVFEKLLGLDSSYIYFTAGGADANNILLNSLAKAHKKGRIISSPIEHPSVLNTLKDLEQNYEVKYVKVDEYGFVDLENLKSLLTDDTILVSIAYVNSELGTIQDIDKISRIVKENNKNTVFHTDFVQGFGHLAVNFKNLQVDAISFSAHKIHGPKGIGAFYLKKGTKFKNTVFGSNTENLLVPRTMPNELVLGFLKAVSLIDYTKNDKLKELKDYAIKRFLEIKDIRINSPKNSSFAILNVAFKNLRGEVILNYLSSKNVYISTGSACSSKKGTSSVIKGINLSKEYMDGVIRLSFCYNNTKEEIDEAITYIKEIVELMV